MYPHAGFLHLHKAEESKWVDKVNEARLNGHLCSWVSTFHPCKLSCRIEGGFLNGSYNLCQIFIFEDGTSWVLRLPRVSSVSPRLADEKIMMEAEALHLIRERTSMPVPVVRALGLSKDNPLELGPFLLMDFIRGISLDSVLMDGQSGLLKEDLRDDDIEHIYRQMARYMLELFQINFDEIGSIPTPQTGFIAPIRPLTWKAHGILHEGGVDVFGDRNKGFDSVTEYLHSLLCQDHKQLKDQPNSVLGWHSACEAHASLEVLKTLLPDLIEPKYNYGPFKLICDDLGLRNLIVRSHDDLTVVGVVDLEWVYAGPAQLFASGPWWLLGDRPNNEAWDYKEGEPPRVASRYMRHLEIFTSVLKEEELKMLGHENLELSTLIEWSRSTGAIWLHMILSAGFFDCESFPCGQLQRHCGLRWWLDTRGRFEDQEEVKEFAQGKELELTRYDEEVDHIEELKSLMDCGKLTNEDFVARARLILERKPDEANG